MVQRIRSYHVLSTNISTMMRVKVDLLDRDQQRKQPEKVKTVWVGNMTMSTTWRDQQGTHGECCQE